MKQQYSDSVTLSDPIGGCVATEGVTGVTESSPTYEGIFALTTVTLTLCAFLIPIWCGGGDPFARNV